MFYYDSLHDILAIHKNYLPDEKFKGNIDVGNLIIDVSSRGRIKGIEIIGVSKFFGRPKKILKEITDAKFTARITPVSIIITIFIKSKLLKQKLLERDIAIPLSKPIL